MIAGDILDKCKALSVAKTRRMDEQYAEVVFFAKDLAQWSQAVSGALGPAAKKKFQKPSREQQALAKRFGGVRHDQTLFSKSFDGAKVVAMFWPWRDKVHITLKIGVM